MADPSVIRSLAPEVIAQIKSSVLITSLNQVVIELVRNSLDARAERIKIDIDYSRGGCIVEDDGVGIPSTEFLENGGLGKPYHSSKNSGTTNIFGRRGCFLSALAALSVVTLTSHHHTQRSFNSLTLYRSEIVSRQTPAPHTHLLSPENGTQVVVRDLFGSMPVRVKQRAGSGVSNKEWDELKRELLHHILAWPFAATLIVRETRSNQRFQLRIPGRSGSMLSRQNQNLVSRTCSVLSQAALIPPNEKDKWVPIRASSSRMTISGAFSILPSASRQVQFISLGIYPLPNQQGQNLLYQEVNRLFAQSSFGIHEDIEFDSSMAVNAKVNHSNKSDMHVKRKGSNRSPMFFLVIENTVPSTCDVFLDVENIPADGSAALADILELLRTVVLEFLRRSHLLPNRPASRSPKKSDSSIDTVRTSVNNSLPGLVSTRLVHGKESVSVDRLGSFGHGLAFPWEKHQSKSRPIFDPAGKLSRAPFDDITTSQQSLSSRLSRTAVTNASKTQSRAISDNDTSDSHLASKGTAVSDTQQETDGRAPDQTTPGLSSVSVEVPMLNVETDLQSESTSWAEQVLKEWQNPVFCQSENLIRQLDGRMLDTLSFHSDALQLSSSEVGQVFSITAQATKKLSRKSLSTAEVISQIDHKFILVRMECFQRSGDQDTTTSTFVLIDQHAADERIRIEQLFEELCSSDSRGSKAPFQVATEDLDKWIDFDISLLDAKVLQRHMAYLAKWGLIFHLDWPEDSTSTSIRVFITALPSGISERCRLEPNLLIHLLQSEAWRREEKGSQGAGTSESLDNPAKHTWLRHIHDCPPGIVELLNSRSCRSAIMFNDVLSKEQCSTIVLKLSECAFPFQCAHGRPSMIPLFHFGSAFKDEGSSTNCFAAAFKRWKH